MNRYSIKFISLVLLLALNASGLLAIGEALAYFSDNEDSLGNGFSAGTLNFSLNNTSFNKRIKLSEKLFLSSVLTNSGTLDWQYVPGIEQADGSSDNFCNSLILNAELNGVEKYDGNLMSFSLPASSNTIGTWNFEVELPVDAGGIKQGDACVFDFVFEGWQENITDYGDGGFSDEEKIRVNLTADMIVLNEFLPNPDPSANGLDYGDDDSIMPDGEWIEIYNNGTDNIDLSEWYIKDQDNNIRDITNLNIDIGSAIIGANGSGTEWLVVYMNGELLNNEGDTIYFYDSSGNLIDSYSYDLSGYCELEPSPGGENNTTTNGDCQGIVPENKSYARIPDGIGDWIDPIPTPGTPNKLSINETQTIVEVEKEIEFLPPVAKIETSSPVPVEIITNTTTTDVVVTDIIVPIASTTEIVMNEATTTKPIIEVATTTTPIIIIATTTTVVAEIIEVTEQPIIEPIEELIPMKGSTPVEEAIVEEAFIEEFIEEIEVVEEVVEESVEETPIIEEIITEETPVIKEELVILIDSNPVLDGNNQDSSDNQDSEDNITE